MEAGSNRRVVLVQIEELSLRIIESFMYSYGQNVCVARGPREHSTGS